MKNKLRLALRLPPAPFQIRCLKIAYWKAMFTLLLTSIKVHSKDSRSQWITLRLDSCFQIGKWLCCFFQRPCPPPDVPPAIRTTFNRVSCPLKFSTHINRPIPFLKVVFPWLNALPEPLRKRYPAYQTPQSRNAVTFCLHIVNYCNLNGRRPISIQS